MKLHVIAFLFGPTCDATMVISGTYWSPQDIPSQFYISADSVFINLATRGNQQAADTYHTYTDMHVYTYTDMHRDTYWPDLFYFSYFSGGEKFIILDNLNHFKRVRYNLFNFDDRPRHSVCIWFLASNDHQQFVKYGHIQLDALIVHLQNCTEPVSLFLAILLFTFYGS